jgi:hypothetical protein
MAGGGSLAFEGVRPEGKKWPPPVESFLGRLETWLADSRFAVAATLVPEDPEVLDKEAVFRLVPNAPGAVSLEVRVFADGDSEPEFHFAANGTLPSDALPSSLKRYADGPREILWAGENDLLDERVMLDMCRGVAEGRIAQQLLFGGKWMLGSLARLSYGESGVYSYYSGLFAFGLPRLLSAIGLAQVVEIRYPAWD